MLCIQSLVGLKYIRSLLVLEFVHYQVVFSEKERHLREEICSFFYLFINVKKLRLSSCRAISCETGCAYSFANLGVASTQIV